MKIYLLQAIQPASELFEDDEVAKLYIVRAPDEAIAREQPKREDNWFLNGGKSPWRDPELTSCLELDEIVLPPRFEGATQSKTPEEYTGLVWSFK